MSKLKVINEAQDALYWREWGYVVKACKKFNFRLPDRHELHVQALKTDKSHKNFTNNDLTEVLKVFRALSNPTSVNEQMRLADMPAKNIIHTITHDYRASLAVLLPIKSGKVTLPITDSSRRHCPNFDVADAYIRAVMVNRFKGEADVNQLSRIQKRTGTDVIKSDLEMFRDTIARCISQARQKIGITVHDLNILAGLQCDCKECKAGIVPSIPCLMQQHHRELLAEDDVPQPCYECPTCGTVSDVHFQEVIDTEQDSVETIGVCEKCGAEVSQLSNQPETVATVDDENTPF